MREKRMNNKGFDKEILVSAIQKSVQEHLKSKHYKVFIFGSRANGDATELSDIDVGIDAGEKVPSGAKLDIQADMDNLRIMQKVDVVDFFDLDDDFKKVALKKIEVIYER